MQHILLVSFYSSKCHPEIQRHPPVRKKATICHGSGHTWTVLFMVLVRSQIQNWCHHKTLIRGKLCWELKYAPSWTWKFFLPPNGEIRSMQYHRKHNTFLQWTNYSVLDSIITKEKDELQKDSSRRSSRNVSSIESIWETIFCQKSSKLKGQNMKELLIQCTKFVQIVEYDM